MTDTSGVAQRRGVHELAILLSTRGWMLLSGLATQAILARILAPEGRGSFAACTMFASVFGVFFALGSDRGAQYEMMSGRQSLSRSTSVGLIIALSASAVAIAIAIPLGDTPLAFFRKLDPDVFQVALTLIPVTLGGSLIDMQLSGSRRFEFLARGIVLQTSLYMVGLIMLVWLLDLGVVGAVLASILAAAAKFSYGARSLVKHCGLRLQHPSREDFRGVLAYGTAYYPARIGLHIDLQMGGLMLATLGTREEVGFFAAATALVFRLFMISDSLEAVMLPRIAATQHAQTDLVGRSVRISALLTGSAAAALALLASPIVHILYSEAFLPSRELIWMLVPGIALYGGAKPLMAYFRGIARASVCSWAIWIGLTINIGLLWLLYPQLGAGSASVSLATGFAVRSIFLALVYRRVSGRGIAETWCPRLDDLVWVRSQMRSSR